MLSVTMIVMAGESQRYGNHERQYNQTKLVCLIHYFLSCVVYVLFNLRLDNKGLCPLVNRLFWNCQMLDFALKSVPGMDPKHVIAS
jgi:hypothetical protein